MNIHKNARLTPQGRLLLVERITQHGWTVTQAARALEQLGANLLVVEMAGRTYFECKEILRLCGDGAACPPGVACILQELDGHAHR